LPHSSVVNMPMVSYPQTNRKTDTGKTPTWWPVLVDHLTLY
ncbi:transposase, partial [Escherichia coli]|nr:transposase [Escherichia coli]